MRVRIAAPLCNFNPRSHERSDKHRRRRKYGSGYFNPRSHERSDNLKGLCSLMDLISIHAPTRGATNSPSNWCKAILFQSTLPREERRSTQQMSSLKRLFQSTLPREERPVAITPTSSKRRISIHAPTRGATTQNENIKNL